VGSGEVDGATEIRAEFWESPDKGVVALLVDRLSQEDSVRSVRREGG
jgi:hypothetical protein